jgi:ABC-type transport system involved in multi-copper enzyme maturation permease subunit
MHHGNGKHHGKFAVLAAFLGWLGAALIVVGLTLTSYEVVTARDFSYTVLHVLGGAFLVVSTWSKKDYSATMLNVVFVIVALSAYLARVF